MAFRVSGTISLKGPLHINEPYITIAGQTAPGDGITLRDNAVWTSTHDVVLRHLRIRPGDTNVEHGTNNTSDAVSIYESSNVVFDHCSASWGSDETFSLNGGVHNVTVQWCSIAEGLNPTGHGYGSIIATEDGDITFHHNVYAHFSNRVPLVNSYAGHRGITLDFRNNLLYDWLGGGYTSSDPLTGGPVQMNYVGNYLRPGPQTKERGKALCPFKVGTYLLHQIFASDNHLEGAPDRVRDNWLMFEFPPGDSEEQNASVRVNVPFPTAPVATDRPEAAYEGILGDVGATLPVRGAVDRRIIADIKNGGGRIIDSQNEVGGWAEVRQATAPRDTDGDGMPDRWEHTFGLNPNDYEDNSLDNDSDGYTNIEEFLNSTDPNVATDPYAPEAMLVGRVETPAGSSVPAEPLDRYTGTRPVSLTFANVLQAGLTGLASNDNGTDPPEGYKLGNFGRYFDVTTTAVFSGAVDICVNYDGTGAGDESTLKLFHRTPDGWKNVTTSLDTDSDRICGSVTSLLTLAVFEEGSDAPTPDFDGDGTVDFTDFIQFAQVFGTSSGDAAYDTRFDLDGGGDIGFTDFLAFAAAFGKPVDAKPARLSRPVDRLKPGVNEAVRLLLAPEATDASDRVDLVVRLTNAVQVQGYNLQVRYKDTALELLAVSAGEGVSIFSEHLGGEGAEGGDRGPMPVAVQVSREAGEVHLADILQTGTGVEGEGDLVHLRFRLIDVTVPGWVEIAEVLVSDGMGRINRLEGLGLEALRALPTEYGLSRNYPNPFNPDTQIPYQLPEAGEVSLAVYNTLGQQVRVLVQERQEAGFYRVVWDGRDARGRQVSSGIYLVRMEAGTFSAVGKVLLLK